MLPESSDMRTIVRATSIQLTRPPRQNGSQFELLVEDLQIFKGQSLFLCGPSGSGKSTLLRVLAGLERPNTGSVVFEQENEIDLVQSPASVWRDTRKLIGMVHQDPREFLNDRRMTADIVADVLLVHRLDGIDFSAPRSWLGQLAFHIPWIKSRWRRFGKAEKLLQRVGISKEEARRTPAKLSGGQRQRVAIARSLISDPVILFLDEPTSALDVSVQAGVMTLISELKAELGLTVVMVTHDLGLARQFADRVVVMDSGRIVEVGDVDRIFTTPVHALTQRLIEASRSALQ